MKWENRCRKDGEDMKFEYDGPENLIEILGPYDPEIVIGGSVEFVGTATIKKNTETKKIVFSDKVEIIEEYAFNNCSKLETVIIGKGIKKIHNHAFDKCPNLKTVEIHAKKNKVKMHAGAFPKTAEIFFDGEKPKTEEDKNQYDISLKELRKVCTVTSRNTGYSINSFSKDGRIAGPLWINNAYVYQFNRGISDKHIFIPNTIDGRNVGHVAVKTIPEDAVIICSAEMFRKLSKSQKASAGIEYLKNPSVFYADEIEEIKAFMKKNPDSLYAGLTECSPKQLDEFLSVAKPKASATEDLLKAVENVPILKAQVMEYQRKAGYKKKTTDDLSLDKPRKMTVADYEKIWNFGKLAHGISSMDYDFTGPTILLHEYLGNDCHVKIPAVIGKTPVRILREKAIPDFVKSVEFEDTNIFIEDTLEHCSDMVDNDGFVIAQVGNRKILTAYIGDINIENLEIPEGVTEMRPEIFCKRVGYLPSEFYAFKSITLPDSVKTISSFAFASCFNLETIKLSASLEKICYRALRACDQLKYIVIPKNPITLEYMSHFEEMNIVIRSEKDSPAEKYAAEHNIPFEAI